MENIDQVTVNQLQALCEELFTLDKKIDFVKAEVKKLQDEFDQKERVMLAHLEKLELKSFKSKYGDIGTRTRTSVKAPQGDSKIEFFEYLKGRGIFEQLATVHSNTLNSWYNQEREIAKEEGRFLRVPGLEMPTTTTSLVMKGIKK